MTGMTTGPTTVMRGEHVEIRRLMDDVVAALEAGEAGGSGRAIHGITDVLGGHNMKEEHVLYPMADQAAGDERARATSSSSGSSPTELTWPGLGSPFRTSPGTDLDSSQTSSRTAGAYSPMPVSILASTRFLPPLLAR
jgi:hypothetical protein